MKKTHWKKLNNPNYLGAYELMGVTDELTVKIIKVAKEPVKGTDGKNEDCIVAHLEGQKPMILNATNCKSITELYKTPFIEEWSGLRITLIVQKIKAFGDIVDALRVKKSIPQKLELTPDNKKIWDRAVSACKKNNNLEIVKKHYKISPQNEKLIKDEANIS